MWEFAAQPSAQRIFERLGRAFAVRPWSKNDNKAHVFLRHSQSKSDTIAVMSTACIYTGASSPHVLIMGAANSGCRYLWMLPILDAASYGCPLTSRPRFLPLAPFLPLARPPALLIDYRMPSFQMLYPVHEWLCRINWSHLILTS